MTPIDAYELALEFIQEMMAAGCDVTCQPSASRSNPQVVERYAGDSTRIPPSKWIHVTFRPKDDAESTVINERVIQLGWQGITFDSGGGMGLLNWELDWSFQKRGVPDGDHEEGTRMMQDLLKRTQDKSFTGPEA